MKDYTLTFIFSEDKKYVLLIYKNHEPCRHYLNGISGKIEPWEYDYKLSAIREIYKEIKERILVDKIFPYKTLCPRSRYILHIFYTFIDKSPYYDKFDIAHESKEGPIKWYKVDDCISNKIDKLELFVPYLIKGIIKKEDDNENKKLLEAHQNNCET